MSYATSSGVSGSGIKPQTKISKPKSSKRSLSAGEIAKNSAHFETWSHHHNLEQTSYRDLPEEYRAEIEEVFNVSSKIPSDWVVEGLRRHQLLKEVATPGFLKFLQQAHKQKKSLFCEEDDNVDVRGLFIDLSLIFTAWQSLKEMSNSESKESWSEADYVANVFTVVRRAGFRQSTRRNQCPVCLPRHLVHEGMRTETKRILEARTVIPDCVVLVPKSLVKDLSDCKDSVFKRLNKHKTISKSGAPSKQSSFPYQATPFKSLPKTACFEFASSFSEDKKPSHESLDDAYRQNRMSTASALRQMHSLHVNAPVFGLVWADSKVKVHVDWWQCSEDQLVVYSAPYVQGNKEKVWNLKKASDLLEVYFLLRNIDDFTVGRYRERVNEGIQQLLVAVIDEGKPYEPWRRPTGSSSPKPPSRAQKENHTSSPDSSPASSPKHSKQKSRAHRKHRKSN